MKTFIIVIVFLIALPLVSQAELYRYRDSGGEIHFVDEISKVPKKYRGQAAQGEPEGNVNVVDAPPLSGKPERKLSQTLPVSEAKGEQKVDVYITSWCGYCKRMIRFLEEKKIPFTSHDVEKDRQAARTYDELGGGGVPVITVGSHVVRGYNPDAVLHYYNSGN